MITRDAALDERIREATSRQQSVSASLASRRADIPLALWRQQAHFTTPAGDQEMAQKAIVRGTEPMARFLDRFGIPAAELADRLGVEAAAVEELLQSPERAPLVMLDGEDAQALRDDVVEQGLENAARLFVEADWGSGGARTLRFFRPPGFALGTTARDLYTVLWAIARQVQARPFPLDGIVFPKVEHPEEVDILYEMLASAERELGLPEGHIRVAFLVESGGAVVRLPEIAARATSRLCSLIFGLADYSADLALPAIETDHPMAAFARAQVVAVASAVGVPAIDGMTLAYPVVDRALDDAANRARMLDRLALVYQDAVRSRELGMAGKWVGHPAQLFATLLAFGGGLSDGAVQAAVADLESYQASVDAGRGATMIGGVMSDRATDRHARALLRRAVALGRLDPARALALGVIQPAELGELATA